MKMAIINLSYLQYQNREQIKVLCCNINWKYSSLLWNQSIRVVYFIQK